MEPIEIDSKNERTNERTNERKKERTNECRNLHKRSLVEIAAPFPSREEWADILFQKHDCSIFRQSSNPVCGFSMMEQVRLCAVWSHGLVPRRTGVALPWTTYIVWICYCHALKNDACCQRGYFWDWEREKERERARVRSALKLLLLRR